MKEINKIRYEHLQNERSPLCEELGEKACQEEGTGGSMFYNQERGLVF